MEKTLNKRDNFVTKWGFIIACIGSAVGMGNIWLFPRRVAEFGAPFLVAYLICVIVIGFSGVVGEMTFGRLTGQGPMGAFEKATETKGSKAVGGVLSLVPVLGSFALAIGYSVVVGWIIKYVIGSFNGSILALEGGDQFGGYFGTMATGHAIAGWHIAVLVITFVIVAFGIAKGIEKLNKVVMPLFFVMFVGILIYVACQNGAADGYRSMFTLSDWSEMGDINMWKYALGQAFFSLSLAGSGTVVYGSYLKKDADITYCASQVALFDTLAAFVAALAIIPAMYTVGISTVDIAEMSGPGLMFISLPMVFKTMPGGAVVMAIFFVAVLFAGLSSLVNLFEAPIEAVQNKFKLGRKLAVGIIAVVGTAIAVAIEGIVSGWMDICSIYICPIGALLAAIMLFWVMKKEDVISEINLGSKRMMGEKIYPIGKYLFCGIVIIVLVLGALTEGGIG